MTRRTKSQWRDLIDQQSSSGLTAAEFCSRHDVNAKYFSLRKKQLGQIPGQPSDRFIQLTPTVTTDSPLNCNSIKLRVTEVELPMCVDSQSDTLTLLLDKLLR